MNGVIYARYSSDSQREESIEGQIRECMEYAERQGITVVGQYIDRALSAKTDDRPDFQRMIKDSAKKLFEVVIVWKLDRFARNRFDSAHYKNVLRKNGVRVLSAKEVISEGPEGIIMESLLEGMAEYYSAELSIKVTRGHKENALKCVYNGGPIPMGYSVDESRHFVINPITAPLVEEIFTLYAEGCSVKTICEGLNARGFKTPYKKAFNKNSLHTILQNRRYLGIYIYSDVEVPGGMPQLISQELFDQVQERLEKNKRAPARGKADVPYLLTTKLYCGKCGAFMVGESGTSHTGKVHYYYKCINTKRSKICDKKPVKKDPLENFVVDYTMKRVLSNDAIEHLADLIMDQQNQENKVIPALRKQLADVEKGIQNILDAIQNGMFHASLTERMDKLEAERKTIQTAITKEELQRTGFSRSEVVFWISQFKFGNPEDTFFRQRLIDTFVNSIYLYDDKIVLTYNFKDGIRTVSFDEANEALDEAEKHSSDKENVTSPTKKISEPGYLFCCSSTRGSKICRRQICVGAGGLRIKSSCGVSSTMDFQQPPRAV